MALTARIDFERKKTVLHTCRVYHRCSANSTPTERRSCTRASYSATRGSAARPLVSTDECRAAPSDGHPRQMARKMAVHAPPNAPPSMHWAGVWTPSRTREYIIRIGKVTKDGTRNGRACSSQSGLNGPGSGLASSTARYRAIYVPVLWSSDQHRKQNGVEEQNGRPTYALCVEGMPGVLTSEPSGLGCLITFLRPLAAGKTTLSSGTRVDDATQHPTNRESWWPGLCTSGRPPVCCGNIARRRSCRR